MSKIEIVKEAHRRLSLLSVDEEPTTDMVNYGTQSLDRMTIELKAAPYYFNANYDLDEAPISVIRTVAWLLAVDLAPHYTVPAPETRERALMRLAAQSFPDDRVDRRDVDGDGVISEQEEAGGRRAEFY